MEYKISQIEISRRKRAYLTLSASVMIGLFFASTILNSPISIGGYLLVLTVIVLIGVFSFRFLGNLCHTKIYLSDLSLKRTTNKTSEEYSLSIVKRVQVKWTTNHTIREIYIWLNNGKSIFISALEHFEDFQKDLSDKLKNNCAFEEMHEPLDFDHPLFYSILGLPISTIGVLILKFFPSMDYQHFKIVLAIFFVYMLLLGGYFLIAKPLSKRYGNKSVTSDYFLGALSIFAAIVIAFCFSMN